jgi:hypothetical protein
MGLFDYILTRDISPDENGKRSWNILARSLYRFEEPQRQTLLWGSYVLQWIGLLVSAVCWCVPAPTLEFTLSDGMSKTEVAWVIGVAAWVALDIVDAILKLFVFTGDDAGVAGNAVPARVTSNDATSNGQFTWPAIVHFTGSTLIWLALSIVSAKDYRNNKNESSLLQMFSGSVTGRRLTNQQYDAFAKLNMADVSAALTDPGSAYSKTLQAIDQMTQAVFDSGLSEKLVALLQVPSHTKAKDQDDIRMEVEKIGQQARPLFLDSHGAPLPAVADILRNLRDNTVFPAGGPVMERAEASFLQTITQSGVQESASSFKEHMIDAVAERWGRRVREWKAAAL